VSRENVDFARRAWDAFDRAFKAGKVGPFLREFTSPDFEYKPMEEAEVIRGYDAYLDYLGRWVEVWDDLSWEVEELLDAGDRVVSVMRMSGRGKETGLGLQMRYFAVSTVQGGKLVRMVEYLDRDEAFEAAGLRE
jgi:ketosteroid isomerase-like protein